MNQWRETLCLHLLNWCISAIQVFSAFSLVNLDFSFITFVNTLLTSCQYIGLKFPLPPPSIFKFLAISWKPVPTLTKWFPNSFSQLFPKLLKYVSHTKSQFRTFLSGPCKYCINHHFCFVRGTRSSRCLDIQAHALFRLSVWHKQDTRNTGHAQFLGIHKVTLGV